MQLGVWGSGVSSPSGVWGGAPAEIGFYAFFLTSGGTNYTNIYFYFFFCPAIGGGLGPLPPPWLRHCVEN